MLIFNEIYKTIPDKNIVGSSGYSNLKHLYDICLEINPTVIIESGSWKGNSSYILKQACPNALIVCHDINFSNLLWKDDSIIYNEYDIETDNQDYIKEDDIVLLYFDDHINQQQRIEWCIEKGYKNIVFDDNAHPSELHTYKAPASPTLQEINFSENYEHNEYTIMPNLEKNRKDTHLTLVRF